MLPPPALAKPIDSRSKTPSDTSARSNEPIAPDVLVKLRSGLSLLTSAIVTLVAWISAAPMLDNTGPTVGWSKVPSMT